MDNVPSTTTLVLLSGDRDFAYPISTLRHRGFNTILISPQGDKTHPALKAQTHQLLAWLDFLPSTNPKHQWPSAPLAHTSGYGSSDLSDSSSTPFRSAISPGQDSPKATGLPENPILPTSPPLDHGTTNLAQGSNTRQSDTAIECEAHELNITILLNQITPDNSETVSAEIISWANWPGDNGERIDQLSRLVFENAISEESSSEAYAILCRRLMEQITRDVQKLGINNVTTGGQLFRKYLLNRCQEEFEGRFVQGAAIVTAGDIESMEAQESANKIPLVPERLHAAGDARHRGLAVVRFMGELFKMQMLTERIMHECVKKLLGNVDTPDEAEIEALCKLLTTIGGILDTRKAKAHMGVYFSRMQEMTRSPNVSSHMRVTLRDVIELRAHKWITGSTVVRPTTLSAVHLQIAKEQLIREEELHRLQTGMSRGDPRPEGGCGDVPQVGPDGWSVAGGAAPRPSAKAGDPSNFGKISTSGRAPISLGLSSISNKKDVKRESALRTGSSSNMFSMLQNSEVASEEGPSSKGGGSSSCKPSVDLRSAEPTGFPLRQKLALLPQTNPLEATAPNASRSAPENGDISYASPEMSDADAKKRVSEDMKEFFAIRNIGEAQSYFTSLLPVHHSILVDQLTSHAIESKTADAELVAELFGRAINKKLVSLSAFETAFSSLAEFLEDIAIDAPKAFELMAIVMSGVCLDRDAAGRVSSKDGSGKLAGLLGA
ncbi:ARM repeat-containing protein [Flagelloscypha sp. PMI_526]|nr:ARM repeat-containing protein [Flagelloscypha sp. PMI_526]